MEYETVIGLEVHVQLNTKTKIFCGCSTQFGADPNTQTCPICQGHPGVLPVLNQDVLKKAVMAGLAFDSKINRFSKFDRKNYFYPDLPKAYQISQYDLPICYQGKMEITKSDGTKKTIGITRMHMEEDAGKLIHSEVRGINETYIDLNRSCTPLIEIVSEPELTDAEEAVLYVTKLRHTLKFLEVSDVNMEEGSLRCDVNISLRPKGSEKLGTRAEIKNLNSFRSIEKAIAYEIERQSEILDNGGTVIQETRLYDPDSDTTRSMRSKEEANDYRYFPDPDLVPIVVSEDFLAQVKKELPELPFQIEKRLVEEYGIKPDDAKILVSEKEYALYFEKTVQGNQKNAQKISNFLLSDVFGGLKDKNIPFSEIKIKPEELGKIFNLIDSGKISIKIAKEILPEMLETGDAAEKIVEKKGLTQISDTKELEAVIAKIIEASPQMVEQYKAGKTKVMGSFVGLVMKETRGKANPQMVNELIIDQLSKI